MIRASFLILPAALCFNSALAQSDCGAAPELNRNVAAFAKSSVNKTVGQGECWDLAAEALKRFGAEWDGHYRFGRQVDPRRDCIFPGDIIQFEGVTAEYVRGNATYRETMSHHTAVIVAVNQDRTYVLAEQNTSDGGRRVRFSPFDPANVRRGTYLIYRPVKP